MSYLVAANGKPISLARQSSLATDPALATAKEWLPKSYSDLGRTTLKATVPPGGGVIDFPLEGPLLDPPAAPEPARADAAEGPETPAGSPVEEPSKTP